MLLICKNDAQRHAARWHLGDHRLFLISDKFVRAAKNSIKLFRRSPLYRSTVVAEGAPPLVCKVQVEWDWMNTPVPSIKKYSGTRRHRGVSGL